MLPEEPELRGRRLGHSALWRAAERYPPWVERCFIFTEQGTFLDRQRTKTDEIPPDDPRNNPVWTQHYVGVWQKIGGEALPSNTSHTRYVVP